MFSSRISKIIGAAAIVFVAGSAIYVWRMGDMKDKEHAAISGGVFDNTQAVAGDQTYTNADYQFSFVYPSGFRVHAFKEEQSGGDIIVLEGDAQQRESTIPPEEKPGLQMFISPFDEEGPITAERILEDVPDMVIDDAKEAIIGGNQIHALIFFSQEESLGKTREVWFVHNGYLYQISALAKFDSWLAGMLKNLIFSE